MLVAPLWCDLSGMLFPNSLGIKAAAIPCCQRPSRPRKRPKRQESAEHSMRMSVDFLHPGLGLLRLASTNLRTEKLTRTALAPASPTGSLGSRQRSRRVRSRRPDRLAVIRQENEI